MNIKTRYWLGLGLFIALSWAAAIWPTPPQAHAVAGINVCKQLGVSIEQRTWSQFKNPANWSGTQPAWDGTVATGNCPVAPCTQFHHVNYVYGFHVDVQRSIPGFNQQTGSNTLFYEVDAHNGQHAVWKYTCTCGNSDTPATCQVSSAPVGSNNIQP